MKKIIVLNGSPRKGGNTDGLVEAFCEGALSAGHEVKRFDLRDMDIHHCLGCQKGGADKTLPCVQHDDMDKIYPAFIDADVLVLASPLYSWGWTAYLKNAFDRAYAITEANSSGGEYHTPHKNCVMLIAAEGDFPGNFAAVENYYETCIAFLKWTDLGRVLAGGVFEIGDVKGKPALEEARRLGASLAT
jgi:multimeric flavodoxin WrbA